MCFFVQNFESKVHAFWNMDFKNMREMQVLEGIVHCKDDEPLWHGLKQTPISPRIGSLSWRPWLSDTDTHM